MTLLFLQHMQLINDITSFLNDAIIPIQYKMFKSEIIKLRLCWTMCHQGRLSNICGGSILQFWWSGKELDYVQWAMEFQWLCIRYWNACTRSMFWMAEVRLPWRRFRHWTILGHTPSASSTCCCSRHVQAKVPGSSWLC